jgi:hypothetical protein
VLIPTCSGDLSTGDALVADAADLAVATAELRRRLGRLPQSRRRAVRRTVFADVVGLLKTQV